MIICGVEEPLDRTNERYSLNEVTGKIEHSGISNERANRYVFVSQGGTIGAQEHLAAILRTILIEVAAPGCWLSAWAIPDISPSPAKALIQTRLDQMAQDRLEENWQIENDGSLYVARKEVDMIADLSPDSGFAPADFHGTGWKRLMMLIGESPELSIFLNGPMRSVLLKFAHSGIFAPNEAFVSSLVRHNISLFFEAREVTDCPALACIGPHVLPIQKLIESHLISELRTGSNAHQVWQLFSK